jgi:5-methyltetrahydrofolate--homocysteine methyltransferase
VVLGCNNYDVIDLGVMVPTEKILQKALEEKVDIIGLSGLITPSLEEMVHVAEEMERLGLDLPLLIGGATTSKIHTAVKISPNYHQPVVYVKDASKSVPVVSSLLSKDKKEAFALQVRNEYVDLAASYAGKSGLVKYLSLDEARENRLKIDWNTSPPMKPKFVGTKIYKDFPLSDIRSYIGWIFFFIVWQLKGKYPDILNDPQQGEVARKLLVDAEKLLDEMISKKQITANGVVSILPASSIGDDIEVYTDETRTEVLTTFRNLRNQTVKEEGVPNLCLSDFIAPKSTGIPDYLGAFTVTTGLGVNELVKEFEKNLDDYNSIMVKALADRLAEAFTELIHLMVRKELWGYDPTESLSMMPAASVSGLIFAHPQSRYFFVDKISRDQVEDYARRKEVSPEQVERWLASNLNYK